MSMWDERYSGTEYFYGTAPNDFLVHCVQYLPAGGNILCIAEGEGRNAVYLARQGFKVTAVDASAAGVQKQQRLAQEHNVSIHSLQQDLTDFDFGTEKWDGIVSVFCHLPPPLRLSVHQRCQTSLKPGGIMIVEAYRPEQAPRDTGGPSDPELMLTEALLQTELPALTPIERRSLERDVLEGHGHRGIGAVVQWVARKN